MQEVFNLQSVFGNCRYSECRLVALILEIYVNRNLTCSIGEDINLITFNSDRNQHVLGRIHLTLQVTGLLTQLDITFSLLMLGHSNVVVIGSHIPAVQEFVVCVAICYKVIICRNGVIIMDVHVGGSKVVLGILFLLGLKDGEPLCISTFQ